MKHKELIAEAVCLVILGLLYLLHDVEPPHREFDPRDPSISRPFLNSDIIAGWLVTFLSVLMVVVTLICEYVGWPLVQKRKKDRKLSTMIALRSALISAVLTVSVTTILKVYVGRLRPDFVSRCVPEISEGALRNATAQGMPLLGDWTCTGDVDVVQKGRRSFPSGHASTAWCGFGWAAWWFVGALGAMYVSFGVVVFIKYRQGKLGFWRVLPSWALVVGALLIASSRWVDGVHNPGDIFAGSLLGIITATTAYLQYFEVPWGSKFGMARVVEEDEEDKEGEEMAEGV